MRALPAFAVAALAAWGSDLAHPSTLRSVVLPLLAAVALVYALVALLLRRPGAGGGAGDAGGRDACASDGTACCGGDGGGD